MTTELEKIIILKSAPRMPCFFPGQPLTSAPKHLKPRLVMKRLRDVKPCDWMVGRTHWQVLGTVRLITGVRESTSKPGKLRLAYALDERGGWPEGRIYRWPDFYVICVKQDD